MHHSNTYDFVVIGSGFGGSVSALRLAEKGYRVLVLERGKRYRDEDFPRSNWNLPKFLWLPAVRCFGFMQFTMLNGVMVLHGSGVGGGSLVYANVLMEPDDRLFEAPAWRDLAEWKTVLRPHYAVAKRMLGVATNPRQWPADNTLRAIADELGTGANSRPTEVGVFFGTPGETVPDPYFDGEGPDRAGCTHCGGCMVGCRYNAKNILVKNYLYLAEKRGVEIRSEATVRDIRPLPDAQTGDQSDGARYAVTYQRSTRLFPGLIPAPVKTVRARNVVVAAGALGTLRLLFHCRDVARTLPDLSPHLGDRVRTNSEALLGITSRTTGVDYSEGVAITSVIQADAVTQVEPTRYPPGSGLIKLMAAPMIQAGNSIPARLLALLGHIARRPLDFLRSKLPPDWARRTTILLVMQTEDNLLRLRFGRHLRTLFGRGLIAEHDPDYTIHAMLPIGHRVAEAFAQRTNGITQAAIHESLLNMPTTAHILGGCPMGRSAADGVIDVQCRVFGYPGLYVVDGSVMPANPGINPSLTITALAEYALSHVAEKA
ncbi:MAG: GMC family oxidoreductase [Anaerolineae bacterium]|nr:GMC family oxidoreductase [Anaerolineae bacterium]